MATKLGLYNGALLALGSARLATLTDAAERRYELDTIYDNVLVECLEDGQWNFAQKSVEIEAATGVDPAFGYQNAFLIPSDYVRLTAISADEYYGLPLCEYHTEAGYWWADVDPVYVSYVSSSTEYGLDLTLWPQSFTRFVELALAERICMRITEGDKKYETIFKMLQFAKKTARSRDAMNQAAPRLPQSNWLNARFSGGNYSGKKYQRA